MLAENKPTVSTNTASHPTLTKKSRRPLRVADVGALGLLADSASLSALGPMAKAYTHCNPCSMYFAENGIHHLGSRHPRAAFSLISARQGSSSAYSTADVRHVPSS